MASRPNILFIMADQMRADALGCYGNPIVRTPNLDRLAREGAQFDWAFASSPECVPSRCSVMTGRYPTATRSRNNAQLLGNDEHDLFKILRAHGYRMGLAGKNHCVHPDALEEWDFVYEEDHVGPVTSKEDAERLSEWSRLRVALDHSHAVASGALPYPKEEFGSWRVSDAAVRFLDGAARSEQPFFLWLSFPDPHNPSVVPEELDGMYDASSIALPPPEPGDYADKPVEQWINAHMMGLDERSEDDVRVLIARYYTLVSGVDEGIGRVLEALDEKGLAENTLVLFVSDHGDFLGEHGCVHKGPTLYDSLIRVPLIFRWPGRIRPTRFSETMAELIDIFPTILDYLDIPVDRAVQGKSLKPLLDGERTAHKDEVYAFLFGPQRRKVTRVEAAEIVARRKAEFDAEPTCRTFRWIVPERNPGRAAMIRTREWKLVHYLSGDGELYDLERDPNEHVNLFRDERFEDVLSSLRARLLSRMLAALDDRPPSGFDPTLYPSGRVRP